MQSRGVSDLRDSEEREFRSVGVEYFATEMQEIHNKIREGLNNSN
jgi:hypothetical protein